MAKDDLISRAAAIDALGECPYNWNDWPEEIQAVNDWQDAIESIKNVPAVDAVPVVHGRWEEHEDCNGDSYYTCSVCDCYWTLIDGTPAENNMRYCPECGAKMNAED